MWREVEWVATYKTVVDFGFYYVYATVFSNGIIGMSVAAVIGWGNTKEIKIKPLLISKKYVVK